MPPLPTNLRKDLEKAVIQARDVAEGAATAALQVLAVDVERAFDTMTEAQKAHRVALRARMRNLAPTDTVHKGAADRRPRGFGPLVEEVAYEQWHRMLFARFLAENELLIHPGHGVALSLEECADLAVSEGEPDEWMVAAKFASAMLPGIFRRDDPAAQVRFAADGRAALERILKALPPQLFQADDALGWVYQFWQTKAKDEVNKSERKVGGKDLAPVTQLFTEHYMVRFLLENSLGAWWAARHPESALIEEWEYLRLRDDGTPAAGTFPEWPAHAKDISVMDPCCGSGHFLVAAADMLRKMRMQEEGLSEAGASAAVLRDNLFGLELDPRCTQIAAFAVVFDAWKHGLRPPAADAAPPLPNIACSGISVGGQLSDWTRLAADDTNLKITLERLYLLFKDAPDLGSLINPNVVPVRDRMFLKRYDEIAPLVEVALARSGHDPAAVVFGADASGVARAGALLARQYTLTTTNPPYLSRGKQDQELKTFAENAYPRAKADLATMFIERCRAFAIDGGSYAMVTPQNWLQLTGYTSMRQSALSEQTFSFFCPLGEEGFESFGNRGPRAVLMLAQNVRPSDSDTFFAIDASVSPSKQQVPIAEKKQMLREATPVILSQTQQLRNPDARIILGAWVDADLLERRAAGLQGVSPADAPHYSRQFWELETVKKPWHYWQSAVPSTRPFGGRELILWRNSDFEAAVKAGHAYLRGDKAWGKRGVAVSLMRGLPCTLYTGELFDTNVGVIVPRDPSDLPAIWAFCSSQEFNSSVRRIDQKLNVTNATLVKVPFELQRWQKQADRLYPDGLPESYSEDPTQWIFRGNVVASQSPLHVAVARLLHYRWPTQTPDALDGLADGDGIVCFPAVQGEKEAAERVRAFLAAAYGDDWSAGTLDTLLADVGYAGRSLDQWLRDSFFEQHCKLFHHRPFIWHVWDGRRDGFSALVNYHKLDEPRLEKLAYTYLGAWMERQRDEKSRGIPGAEDRLAAAQVLQQKLALILEGEPPYDIYVRWKKLHEQPIGWAPDLDDGARLNIRPFMTAGVLRWQPKSIKWGVDRGKNPDGSDRVNDLHFTIAQKQEARRKAGVSV